MFPSDSVKRGSRLYFHPLRKKSKKSLEFYFLRTIPTSISTHEKKKKTSKSNHFSSRYEGSKLEEKISQRPHGCWIPVQIFIRQKKAVRTF
jgi:hypothetical protein